MNLFFVTLLGLLFFSHSVFGMGGDKPGPNGGYITMPGTYHVELVTKKDKFIIYLLDLSMKNPTVDHSQASLKLVKKDDLQHGQTINCKAEMKTFVCSIPNNNLENYSEIKVESMRNKIKGKVASYKLPLHFN